jgi:hypothetical protein
MMEAKSIESGKTSGTNRGIEKSKNFNTIEVSKSLPANSAISSQTVCKMNIKKRITNTTVNVIRKVFKMYLSIIFT